jgi:hypothetical protein
MLAVLFAAICLAALFWTALTLAIYYFDTSDDRFGTPWRLLVSAAGFVGLGAGGLVAAVAGLNNFGVSMATLVGVVAALLVLFVIVLPWLRRRRGDAEVRRAPRPPG